VSGSRWVGGAGPLGPYIWGVGDGRGYIADRRREVIGVWGCKDPGAWGCPGILPRSIEEDQPTLGHAMR
jgi:hypothetical protein